MKRAVLSGLGLLAVLLLPLTAARPGVGSADPAEDVRGMPVPDEARLRARIAAFSAATDSRDARGMYEMLTPYVRSHMTLGDYRRDSGLDERWAKLPPTQLATALEQVCSCSDWTYPDDSRTFRCVLLLSGNAARPGDPSVRTRWLEMWERTGDEWYYGITGEGDRCPGEEAGVAGAPVLSAPDVPLPDEAKLIARLQAYYDAILAKDVRVMYDTQTPSARSEQSLEDYRDHGGMALNLGLVGPTASKVTVRLEQTCSCSRFERPYPMTRCNVLVSKLQEDAGGAQTRETHIELWEHADGEWFYVIAGGGSQCATSRRAGGPPAGTDRSPEAQLWRAKMVKSLISADAIRRIECGPKESSVVVRPQFIWSSRSGQELMACIFYFYCFDGLDETALLVFRQELSSKVIGKYSPTSGLKMK